MLEDMESKGIYFDLQWKTKAGVSSGEEFASIGIWEVDESSLDWLTFKLYLCQTLGNIENLAISYVDADGDEIPIDSDCEFQEALKFARRKAAREQKIILKVEKQDSQSVGAELSSSPIPIKSSNFIMEKFKMAYSNNEDQNSFRLSAPGAPVNIKKLSCKVKEKAETKENENRNPVCLLTPEVPFEFGNLPSKVKSKPEIKDSCGPSQNYDSPPIWFKKYMQKMKNEIIADVTANVSNQVKKMLEDLGKSGHKKCSMSLPTCSNRTDAWIVTKTKKKSDDDSSDGVHKFEHRDSKILKKIEKLQRREKKLDHKKEKLEQKTKRIAERKEKEYLSRLRLERAGCTRSHYESFSHRNRETERILNSRKKPEVPENKEPLPPPKRDQESAHLAVDVLYDNKRTTTVERGSKFTKTWKVINNGTIPWTDETEVRLSWGNSGLDPETVVMKCPPLSPGEEGLIFINFNAPEFPGLFESHWHFFHKNIRFGNSICCIVAVDLIRISDGERIDHSSPSSSEFCMVSNIVEQVHEEQEKNGEYEEQDAATNDNEEMFVSTANHETILPKINSFSSAAAPWGSINDKDEAVEKDDSPCCEKRKELEFESISTDDLSGSVASLGSDSDDNFVVVPMPACFRFDVPLNACSSSSKPEKPESEEKTVSPNHQQQSPFKKNIENESIEKENSNSFPSQEQNEISCDTGEVITKPITQPEVSVTTETDQSQIADPVLLSTTPRNIVEQSKEHRVQVPKSSSSINDIRNISTSSRQSPDNNESRMFSPPNIPSPQPRKSSKSASSSPVSNSQHKDLISPVVSKVWNGAMNVTASALNTAFAAMDSVLLKPSESSAPNATQQSDGSQPQLNMEMINNLSKLINMGFTNMKLNEALLRVHNFNIEEVIDVLLDQDVGPSHP